jgi:hypothetical protein
MEGVVERIRIRGARRAVKRVTLFGFRILFWKWTLKIVLWRVVRKMGDQEEMFIPLLNVTQLSRKLGDQEG